VLVAPAQEDEIWLRMQDFRRIETPGATPFPEDERLRPTLRLPTLTPAGEQQVTPAPQQGASLEWLLIPGNALVAPKRYAGALPAHVRSTTFDPRQCHRVEQKGRYAQ
jgi:hypothetical protein